MRLRGSFIITPLNKDRRGLKRQAPPLAWRRRRPPRAARLGESLLFAGRTCAGGITVVS